MALGKLKEDLTAQISEVKNSIKPAVEPFDNFKEICKEVREREKRKKNIIVFGFPEQPDTVSTDTRSTKDDEIVNDILTFLQPNVDITILKSQRLGRFNAANANSRPIKATLNNESDVFKYISKANRLRTMDRFKNINVSTDRTPKQISYFKHLKSQLDERTKNGETNLKNRHVNNIPKIVSLNH